MVKQVPDGTGRGGNAQVENREDVPVEVQPERGGTGELPEDILLLQAGNPAGFEDFLVHGRIHGVIPSQDGFREEDGDVAVEGRVLQLRDQVVPLAEKGPAGEIVGMGDGKFRFAVQAGFPGRKSFRIVPAAVLSEIVQDGTDVSAVPEGALVAGSVRDELEIQVLSGP